MPVVMNARYAGGAGGFSLSLDTRFIGVRLEFLGHEQTHKLIQRMKQNLANLTPLFSEWETIWKDIMDQRFQNKGKWRGGKSWEPLSLFSSVPIRTMRDLTRVGNPKRYGGDPAVLFETLGGGNKYKNSWSKARANILSADANQVQGGTMQVENDHPGTINEFPRDAEGCFSGHRVPARPWAWLVGDGILHRALGQAFHEHVWDGVDDWVAQQNVAW
jgi:hypothetical protein